MQKSALSEKNYGKITARLRHDLRPLFIYLHRKPAVFQPLLRHKSPVLLNSSRFHGIIPRMGIPPSITNYGGIYATHNTSSTRQGLVLCRTHPGTGPCRCRHLSPLFYAKTDVSILYGTAKTVVILYVIDSASASIKPAKLKEIHLILSRIICVRRKFCRYIPDALSCMVEAGSWRGL